ncbi:Cys-tRNA(Pro) deacylase [Acetanaerobacterium elongatum]|uniref:Cys-tRNA(Pro)/Cys-tRNA(Cys) deacylase n=1 Tax=Acetanaerobacterium elongatum TaxID=258515 RepID=A0A1G9U617_9FIRM|nr:Cys-tRNA(Pro) deacylase [Acetanaerobacterium elongatum]SDM55420.1 Cys-tRNA(Pro)/Cys-tRNA(Cys) deacylase [Acetanaerobacterium elongatum]
MSDIAKTNAMRMLDSAGIEYQIHTYEPGDAIDGVSVAHKLGKDASQVYKTLVTQGKGGGYFVFVLPVNEELDLKKAARAAGEKAVEMIPVKDINKVTGYIRGGCSPVGMKKLYPTVIHEDAILLDTFTLSGGKIGMQMELNPEALCGFIGAKFEDIIL